jgi:hypothetical protein
MSSTTWLVSTTNRGSLRDRAGNYENDDAVWN